MISKPDYRMFVYRKTFGEYKMLFIYLEDLDKGNISLTNGMEGVLKDLEAKYQNDWPPTLIFYRDSEGQYAKVNIRSIYPEIEDSDNRIYKVKPIRTEVQFTYMEPRTAHLLLAGMDL